jgi:hypothetical protein
MDGLAMEWGLMRHHLTKEPARATEEPDDSGNHNAVD